MRVLGINATSGRLWLCLVDGDGAIDTDPAYVELGDGSQAGYAIAAFRQECVHALTALAPDRVVFLDIETGGRVPKVADMRKRFTAEALFASCAVDAGLTCARISRAAVRSRLDLPRSGGLGDHATKIFDTPVGKHWTKRRDLAALAARAELVGT